RFQKAAAQPSPLPPLPSRERAGVRGLRHPHHHLAAEAPQHPATAAQALLLPPPPERGPATVGNHRLTLGVGVPSPRTPRRPEHPRPLASPHTESPRSSREERGLGGEGPQRYRAPETQRPPATAAQARPRGHPRPRT